MASTRRRPISECRVNGKSQLWYAARGKKKYRKSSKWLRSSRRHMADGLWRMTERTNMAFRFEGLEIFHVAVDCSVKVYELVKKFPSEERFDLTSQARCAANSIVLNIAEGSGRGTKRLFSL